MITTPTPSMLRALPAEHRQRLMRVAREVDFPQGKRLFEEGGRADRFWIIREGHVRLDTHLPAGGEVVVETLGPGAVLGWSWLFAPYRWHFGATAMETTLALELDGPGVRGLFENNPVLGNELLTRFMAVVVERLQATRLRLLDLYGTPA